jgi:hypothetical protein
VDHADHREDNLVQTGKRTVFAFSSLLARPGCYRFGNFVALWLPSNFLRNLLFFNDAVSESFCLSFESTHPMFLGLCSILFWI